MLEHKELIAAIHAHYPGLIHGKDFWVGQPMDGDTQTGPARIYQWGIPEYYQEEVEPERVIPEHIIPAVFDGSDPEVVIEPERIIPARTIPAVTEQRTRYISEHPEPTEEELAQWVADNADAYELTVAASEARGKRDGLLIEADNMLRIAEDGGIGDVTAIRAYRQALRDVPQQEGFPFDVEWPVAP